MNKSDIKNYLYLCKNYNKSDISNIINNPSQYNNIITNQYLNSVNNLKTYFNNSNDNLLDIYDKYYLFKTGGADVFDLINMSRSFLNTTDALSSGKNILDTFSTVTSFNKELNKNIKDAKTIGKGILGNFGNVIRNFNSGKYNSLTDMVKDAANVKNILNELIKAKGEKEISKNLGITVQELRELRKGDNITQMMGGKIAKKIIALQFGVDVAFLEKNFGNIKQNILKSMGVDSKELSKFASTVKSSLGNVIGNSLGIQGKVISPKAKTNSPKKTTSPKKPISPKKPVKKKEEPEEAEENSEESEEDSDDETNMDPNDLAGILKDVNKALKNYKSKNINKKLKEELNILNTNLEKLI
jgi:hypothetical protein